MFGWTPDQTVTFVSLLFPTVVSVVIPAVYAPKANLLDPLARALLAMTTVIAATFVARTVAMALYYNGMILDSEILHWASRVNFAVIGAAEMMFLFALLRVLSKSAKRGESV